MKSQREHVQKTKQHPCKSEQVFLAIFLTIIMALLGILPGLLILKPQQKIAAELLPNEPVVRYSAFGAKGDGVHDDLAAIQQAHAYANEHGIAVAADLNATYYLGANDDKVHQQAAIIKTNTYWLNAKFIIDDQNITTDKVKNADIFVVEADTTATKVNIPENYSLTAGQKNIGIAFPESKLLYVVNKNKKDFIRSGVDQNNGTDRQEVILVDKAGNVAASTPITWDYQEVTSLTAYSVTDRPLTICGGSFTTMEKVPYMSYVNRAIRVMRSNVTVKNVQHGVIKESQSGASYSGFLRVEKAQNVTFEECVFWGRCTPIRDNGLTQGTYDISAKLANNVTWKSCTQGNSLRTGWGIMGSNHSKNLAMIDCRLSRFDAHQGVYNATIKDSELNAITLIGGGKLLLENVTRNCVKENDYGEAEFMSLRADYGATWHGEVVMKNCQMMSNAAINYLIKINHKYDWDYGYQCYMPTTVTLDNVNVNYCGKRAQPYPYFYVFSNLDLTRTLTPEIWSNLSQPLVLTKKVTVKNCDTQYLLTHNKTNLLNATEYVVDEKIV